MRRAKRFSEIDNKLFKELSDSSAYPEYIGFPKIYEDYADIYLTTEQRDLLTALHKDSAVLWYRDVYDYALLEACERVRDEREELQWEQETFLWLQDPKNRDSEIYSDVFKDFYGFRPRF